jgi:hypothetical protein
MVGAAAATLMHFVALMLWLPVPDATSRWLHADSTVRGALLPMNSVTGAAGLIFLLLSSALTHPLAGASQGVALRAFGGLLIAAWLITTGMAMWPAHNKAWAALVLLLGLYVAVVSLGKVLDPQSVLDLTLPFVLPLAFGVVSVGLVRARGI